MTDKLTQFNKTYLGSNPYPDLKTGWTIRVYQKIKEGEKTRIQSFEGIIISKKHGNEPGGTITVRKISNGIGVEKIFPLRLPTITKIEVIKKSETRKSKLYYLREKTSKETRKKIKNEKAIA
jgi:large subunit ribosomal protein L19